MAIFRVTACWYETVQVEAEDEDTATEKAYEELRSEIRQKGYVDDYEVTRLDDEDDEDNSGPNEDESNEE